jgi:hypothetical protein
MTYKFNKGPYKAIIRKQIVWRLEIDDAQEMPLRYEDYATASEAQTRMDLINARYAEGARNGKYMPCVIRKPYSTEINDTPAQLALDPLPHLYEFCAPRSEAEREGVAGFAEGNTNNQRER